jgi:ribonuclease HI
MYTALCSHPLKNDYCVYRNVSEPLAESDRQTSNVAELRAAIKAIQIIKENGNRRNKNMKDPYSLSE